jgi:phage tail sheath protein FI
MAATFVSAGVYIQEKDNSLYAPALAPTIIGIVGTATRGTENVATLVTNESQLIDTFGEPRTKDYGLHAAIEALKAARLVYYVRIAGAAATQGTIAALDAGSAATAASIGPSANVSPFNLLVGSVESPVGTRTSTIRFNYDNGAGAQTDQDAELIGVQAVITSGNAGAYNLNAIDGGNATTLTIRIDGGITQTITFDSADAIIVANGGYAALTAAGAAHVINSQILDAEANYSGAGVLLRPDTYGTNSTVQVTGGNANDAVNGFNFSTTLVSAVGGNVADLSAVTAAEIETEVELTGAVPGDILVDVGLTGTVTCKTGTTGAAKAIEIESALSTAVGASPLVNLTPLDSTQNGSNAAAAASTVSFTALTKGSHSANIKVRISASIALTGTVKIEILYKDVVVETFDKLLKTTAATPITGSYALETAITSGITGVYDASEYVTCASTATAGENPVAGTYTLSTGNDGDNWTPGTVVGTVSGTTRTGLEIFSDPEQIYVNLLACPGISYAAVISQMLSICETRADCLAIIDSPSALSPAQVTAWHNGDSTITATVDQESRTETNSTTFNSSYGALYYPFVQIFDKYNEENIFVPPSAVVLRSIAYTDTVADPWFAPAGPNRSQSISVLDLEYSPTLGERDLMQLPANNVNPIANIASVGVTIMGQKTLQRAPTALDRVNVRRLLLVAEKLVAQAVLYLTFEPNDSIMWRRFINLVEPVFSDIKARRGVYDFRIVADSSTTTDTLINQNTFLGKIFLQPTKAAEKLIVSFNLVPTGANFEEYAQA